MVVILFLGGTQMIMLGDVKAPKNAALIDMDADLDPTDHFPGHSQWPSNRHHYLPTRGFYLRCGYRQEALLKDFYAPGDDKVIYIKLL